MIQETNFSPNYQILSTKYLPVLAILTEMLVGYALLFSCWVNHIDKLSREYPGKIFSLVDDSNDYISPMK